ncbi:SSI family serine proteinase inhibitor [Nocardiopsis sp. CNR-923]|uniref:SSI family serine proteinase inhibitor n=1 Tax=Nocardiopsis sp. CNR-923 TaxID=1904965 RepID=UPI00117D03AA|nr:SSI family serine proteinase inhibitor [Nocardiopsis sp. CNR-923]
MRLAAIARAAFVAAATVIATTAPALPAPPVVPVESADRASPPEPLVREAEGRAVYRLIVVDGVGFGNESVREVSLLCSSYGSGGTHPRAAEACSAIARAGSIAAVSSDPAAVCTLEYRPVAATAMGAEAFQETYGNGCLLRAAKRAVFDF